MSLLSFSLSKSAINSWSLNTSCFLTKSFEGIDVTTKLIHTITRFIVLQEGKSDMCCQRVLHYYFLYQCCDFLDTAINISRWPNLFLKTYLLSDREWRGGDCKRRYLNPLQADSSVKHPPVHWTSLSFRTYGQLNALVAFLSQSPAVKLWWKAWNQLIYDMSNNKGAHVHIL